MGSDKLIWLMAKVLLQVARPPLRPVDPSSSEGKRLYKEVMNLYNEVDKFTNSKGEYGGR